MFKKYYLYTALLTALIVGACTTSQQRKTYNTIYTVGQSVDSSYKAYNDLVIIGALKTNSFPKVASAYDQFQLVFKTTVIMFQYNTNALAPQPLIDESVKVITIINQAKQEDK